MLRVLLVTVISAFGANAFAEKIATLLSKEIKLARKNESTRDNGRSRVGPSIEKTHQTKVSLPKVRSIISHSPLRSHRMRKSGWVVSICAIVLLAMGLGLYFGNLSNLKDSNQNLSVWTTSPCYSADRRKLFFS